MFIYEKNGKLNILVNETNQSPSENPDIVIAKEAATEIFVDGVDIVSSESESASESESESESEEPK